MSFSSKDKFLFIGTYWSALGCQWRMKCSSCSPAAWYAQAVLRKYERYSPNGSTLTELCLHIRLHDLQPLPPSSRKLSWSILGSSVPCSYHSPPNLTPRCWWFSKLWRFKHSLSGRFHRSIEIAHRHYGSSISGPLSSSCYPFLCCSSSLHLLNPALHRLHLPCLAKRTLLLIRSILPLDLRPLSRGCSIPQELILRHLWRRVF